MSFSIFAKIFFHKICHFRENSSRVEKYKGGKENLFANPQITNPQILGSFLNHKSANFWSAPVRKFVMINPQIANFLGDSVRKSQILKFARKIAVFLIQIVLFFSCASIF
jgi:hypothetical protein